MMVAVTWLSFSSCSRRASSLRACSSSSSAPYPDHAQHISAINTLRNQYILNINPQIVIPDPKNVQCQACSVVKIRGCWGDPNHAKNTIAGRIMHF